MSKLLNGWILAGLSVVLSGLCMPANATPANRIALRSHFGKFLSKGLDNCSTCHQPQQLGKAAPTSLAELPHNAFGNRLRLLGEEWRKAGRKADVGSRIQAVATEDADGDGTDNLTEILLGHRPGDLSDKPSAKELSTAPKLRGDFTSYISSYRWQPFEPVRRPAVPKVRTAAWKRNPIDAFITAEHESRSLKPRPPASKTVLLRRLYIDLIGLSPTPEEIAAFENDHSPNAYEKVVDRLLGSPRYGERWGRHWMDVWRYSDWAGWGDQVRDSKPHIWRWRDWIVESINKDKGYDRMVQEMLAADELAPGDDDARRATGFLVRNFKLLSREQWMEDVVGHTSKAFLGVTMHCAKCHDHFYDPIPQAEYYRLRAIFEPHNVRTDRLPGQPDVNKAGLVHAFDADPKAVTYFYPRGDERHPDKDRVMTPGVPEVLGGSLTINPVKLPLTAYRPDRRDFEVKETVEASEKAVAEARKAVEGLKPDASADTRKLAELKLRAAEARHSALLAVLKAEKLEDDGQKDSEAWKQAASETVAAQRQLASREAELALASAQSVSAAMQAEAEKSARGKDKAAAEKAAAEAKTAAGKIVDAQKALDAALAADKMPLTTAYKPRTDTNYPSESTGRRLAFARWITDRQNPLAARVAVNHIWARHFGQGIVPSSSDFGRNGRPPSHPQLLDWLAAEFMDSGWSIKKLHRLIVTSNTYRMASTPDLANAKTDPDNIYLWRMNSRRMEAEAVRDNVLWTSDQLDLTMGGPEVDHNQGLASRRRSIYLRIAAEKEVEFLKIFDSPSVTECYERKPSVMPQQALALANSELTVQQARLLGKTLQEAAGTDDVKFVTEAFLRVLARKPTAEEARLCGEFLKQRAQPAPGPATVAAEAAQQPAPNPLSPRESLLLVLFNHNDFVTVR
jgi:hypothetical protein